MSKKVLIGILVAVLVTGAAATYFARPDLFSGRLISPASQEVEYCKDLQIEWGYSMDINDLKGAGKAKNAYANNNCASLLGQDIAGNLAAPAGVVSGPADAPAVPATKAAEPKPSLQQNIRPGVQGAK